MKLKKSTPIKRHESLQPLSRQHHTSLLFCWKIRTGFNKDIPANRMKAYANWFFHAHLKPHFEAEEKHIFPLLDSNNKLVKKALTEHRRLTRLFKSTENPEKVLGQIEEELDAHIRFEERVLFNEIQKCTSPEILNELEMLHNTQETRETTS